MTRRDPVEIESVLWSLQQTCALGHVLEVGCGNGSLVRRLLDYGVDASGLDGNPAAIAQAEKAMPGRCVLVSGGRWPFRDEAFDTVVSVRALQGGTRQDFEAALTELARVTRRHLYLHLPSGGGGPQPGDGLRRDRDWWERRFFGLGFRRHPALVRLVGYGTLEDVSGEFVVLLERIGAEELAAFPLERLAPERDLHMDMLRETGRRSDAHLQRYEFAAGMLRQNDTVVDVACGLGYGAAVLGSTGRVAKYVGLDNSSFSVRYARSMYAGGDGVTEFREGDAHTLPELAENSVHLLVSFETLEHLSNPAQFLARVWSVLAPGGRLIASVPNRWVDASGRDPNPHHLHVFDAAGLLALFDDTWIVEKLFAQTAGGGMKQLAKPVRAWWQVDPHKAQDEPAEWWVVVAMKDPIRAGEVPYVETEQALPPGCRPPNATAFHEAYRNPWVRHAFVSAGIRISDPPALERFGRRLLEQASDGSVERGAVLCVLGYRLLEPLNTPAEPIVAWLGRIEEWLRCDGESLHHFRWGVSLEFLAGRLCLAIGRRVDALRWFECCARRDALSFSPLLGTKTVEAAFLVGLLHARDGRIEIARQWWESGVNQAGRACGGQWSEVIGSPHRPLMFGFRELAQVLDSAARCAAGLNASSVFDTAPGRMTELIQWASGSERWQSRELQLLHQIRSEQFRLQTEHLVQVGERNRALADIHKQLRERNLALVDLQIWRLVAESRARPLWIWGAGRGGRLVAEEIARREGRIAGFIISTGSRREAMEQRLPVVPWSEVSAMDVVCARAFIGIVSSYAAEIEPLLTGAGWRRNRNFEVVDAPMAVVLIRGDASVG